MLRTGRHWRNKHERKNAKIESQMGWRDKWLSRLVHTVAQKQICPKVITDARGCKLSPHESRKGISPLARPIHPIRCNRIAPDGTKHRLNVTDLHARTRALDCSYTCLSLRNTIWKKRVRNIRSALTEGKLEDREFLLTRGWITSMKRVKLHKISWA